MIEKIKDFFGDFHNQLDNARWVWKYSRHHRSKVINTLIIGVASSVVGIMISLIVKWLIDGATEHNFHWKNLVLYGAVLLVSECIAVIWNFLSIKYDELICQDIRKKLLSTILCARWSSISEYKVGDLQTRMTSDVDRIADGISDLLPSMLTFGLQLLLTLLVLAYYNVTIALAALIAGVVGVAVFFLVKGKIYQLQLRVQEGEAINRSHMIECCSNIAFIKSFSAEKQSAELFRKIQNDKYGAVRALAFANNRSSFVLNMVFNISYLAAFGLGIFFLSGNAITYGTLSLYIVLAGRIQGPMVSIAKSIPQVIWMLSSAGRIKALEDIPPEQTVHAEFPEGGYGIHVSDVAFAYHPENGNVLEHVSFDIASGETVGLIGRSGSGKTTMINLILSLLTPDVGQIDFVSDNGQHFMADTATRKLVGYVPQGNMLISGTVVDNVRFGVSGDISEDEIIAALKIAEAYDFVSKTRHGIHTVIGEQGKGLSQGQAQRIAIARSLVRRAPIIVMDEATSALDPETETAILNNIMAMEHRPTLLFISHRPAALTKCDRVLSVTDGTICESTAKFTE